MLKHTVKDYLAYFFRKSYPALFNEDTLRRLDNVNRTFGTQQTDETILEVRLSDASCGCDYSFRVDIENAQVKNYWLELDSEACDTEQITPCYFIDAHALSPGKDYRAFCDTALVRLAGARRAERLRKRLGDCTEMLAGRCEGLFQLGAMEGRGQEDSIRIFTREMKRPQLLAYLREIGWQGDFAALDECLVKWEPFSELKQFILDFDLFENKISSKIGINFGLKMKNAKTTQQWLSFLESEGLCTPEKKAAVLQFTGEFPSYKPYIQNDISHFKLPFENGKVQAAKAYLRQGSVVTGSDFRAYEAPTQMNLELTTRCPLHCPQCYCDLNRGKELDEEKAVYWLTQAASCGVQVVNLSGGETMCYKPIYRLLQVCKKAGLVSNIALSGWGVDEHSLQMLIDSGVDNIFVSVNGSTEAINQKSRDGYHLAINALELLKKRQFPSVTVNWVMHCFNADDFGQMLQLAERYQVKALVVMMFKPNAAHEMPSVPSAEQVKAVAKQIRAYKGNVSVSAEDCFSQMRALLGKRFFVNLNQGITRGCGAGRDSISVSVDGKLTPCRHLEIEEDYDSITEYWNNSKTLKQLRTVEDTMQEPCATCEYKHNCLPCNAINYKQRGVITMGAEECPIRPHL